LYWTKTADPVSAECVLTNNHITSLICTALKSNVLTVSPLSGGSISPVFRAELDNGSSVFVKSSPQYDNMFIKEANGLRELMKGDSLRIPEILYVNEELLILEHMPATSPTGRTKFFEKFGAQLAMLHRTASDQFGFDENNYIGATPQKNLPRSSSWKEFYFVNRLEYQFRLAEQNGYAAKEISSLFHILEHSLDRLIPDDGESPALLHGDLWSGNFLCIEENVPVIFDPAVYYGHREADLAMTLLFGGFDESFYCSYTEVYPLNNEWKRRSEVYKLYHLLNHLNLFGEGYSSQVYHTLKLLLT